MTGQVRDWLPLGALARAAVNDAIERSVAAWSAQWFVSSSFIASRFQPCRDEPRDMDNAGWRLHGGQIALSCSNRGKQKLAERALGASVNPLELTGADRELIEALEAKILDSLADHLEAALGSKRGGAGAHRVRDPFSGTGGLVVGVAENLGPELVSIAIPSAALFPLCRSSLGGSDRRPTRLEPLGTALAEVPVTLEATLGHADVRLKELQDLAPGDVLVLDAAVNAPVTVTVRGAGAFARARLAEEDGQMALVFNA